MNDNPLQPELDRLRARVAALEQLQEESERVVLEQSIKLEQSVAEARQRAHQLKLSEEALQQHTRILHSVLDSMGHGVIVTDAEGQFLVFNPSARQILGDGPDDTSRDDSERH